MMKIFYSLKFAFVLAAVLFALSDASRAQSSGTTATTKAQAAAPTQDAGEKTQPRRPTRKAATTAPSRVTVIAGQSQVAPQVVTIVHRLSGVKMLRYLLRQRTEGDQVFTIDPDAISNDAHASIIAGWALDDGKTIAARLPQAGAEIEFGQFPMSLFEPGRLSSTATAGAPLARTRTEPDLTVITNDGRRLHARYIGLDGQTGLSVLQVNGLAMPTNLETAATQLAEGQRVQVFAPERTNPTAEAASRNVYVKVAVTDAKISKVAQSAVGIEKLTVRGANFSPVILGGVACDESGKTLGIVDAFENNDAHIVPADTIRAATRRVLEKQTSVPKPLLGVRGEPVDLAARSAFLTNGWREDQLNGVMQKQLGILLTLVMPGTPAALAKLLPGDVIVSVNKELVKSAEEFSKLLDDAGSGAQVQFAVRRPGLASEVAVEVKLGGSFDPVFDWYFEVPPIQSPSVGLNSLGLWTATLSWESVSPLAAAQTGLLVVGVQPESAAARSGIQEGDVIESIDGRRVGRGTWVFTFNRHQKHVFSVVRNREKKQIVLEAVE